MKQKQKLYMVGNTHFDPVWLWRWDEAMASIRATFRAALDRMKEDADFVYSFCTPPVFEWIRRVDPPLFAEIRERVREGRWELAEAWWVQPDCYSASGESYIRQGLYGQRYLLRTFGEAADCVFNIDSFGHSPMLPQILQKSGVRNYCFVRPEPHHVPLEHALFRWQSPDGSAVLAYRAFKAYKNDTEARLAMEEGGEDALIVYGVTDHGGAPTKAAIAAIHADERAEFSTVRRFFAEHTTDYTVTEELLTGDFGPYANLASIKKRNRIAEYALLNAERATLIAGWDERTALTAAWQDVLFNQFHDILGGASIKDAYIDAENQLGRAVATANETMHFALQSVTRSIRMLGENPTTVWNLVLWNLNAAAYDGYVEAEVQWVHEFPWYSDGIALEDADGVRYPCQILREKSVIPRFRSRFLFRVSVPAMGYKVLKVIQTNEDVPPKPTVVFPIQTKCLTVDFSETDGTIRSVVDRRTGTALAARMLMPTIYSDLGDTWAFNIEGYEADARRFTFLGFETVENGELMTEIKGTYRLGDSLLEMYYRFWADADEFDVRYRVHWEEKHAVLKLECDVADERHTVAVPAGAVERGASPTDVPLGAWVRTGEFGIASDGIFAYRMQNKSLGLTLLRSPIYGDLRIKPIDETLDYDIIDRGIVEGRLRVFFAGDPWATADALVNPPVVIDECNHDGELPAETGYLSLAGDGVTVSALKRCEDGEGVILRLIETRGDAVDVRLGFGAYGGVVRMQPYEIKTLRILGEAAVEVDLLERDV